jgi:hypothetical protein
LYSFRNKGVEFGKHLSCGFPDPPEVNRAASAMTASVAGSRCIYDRRFAKNSFPAITVDAHLNSPSVHRVNISAHNARQFFFHRYQIQQGSGRFILKNV